MKTIEELLHRRNDLSTFVVHFTRDTPTANAAPVAALDNLLSILKKHRLNAVRTFGMAEDLSKKFTEVAATQKVVCFTETPLEHAWMMCEEIENRDFRFNGYGVAFTKTFARRRGANPVWYLDITAGHDWLTNAVNNLRDQALNARTDANGTVTDPAKLAAADILRLTPFIEQMGQPTSESKRKEFWWEREWRYVGDLNFTASDIVVVFAPEDDHATLGSALENDPNYRNTMPAIVDARWGLERMIGSLTGVTDLGPFPK